MVIAIPKTKAQLGKCLKDKVWRKNNLYTIVDESGQRMPYRQRDVQRQFAASRHGLDVILKSRQHGFSSEVDIDMLDDCLMIPNLQCGIIAHTKIDAQEIFETKVKLPYMELPDSIRRRNPALKCDAGHLRLANGSSIRVAVSFRSATTHRLHVSELGKICAKYPKRAEEIKTGTLPSVHPQLGGTVVIEGTAEGAAGDFYDLCVQAQSETAWAKKEGRPLNKLQYKFHFYAWHEDPKNAIDLLGINISDELHRYFEELADKGIATTLEQQAWYAATRDGSGGLGRKMKREHPSTVDEAFEQSVEGAIHGEEMSRAYDEGRVGFYPYNRAAPVYTFWDLGYYNATAVIFAQFIKEEIRIIDYYEMTGRGSTFHAKEVNRKEYNYGGHYAPHDIMNHEKGTGIVLKDMYKAAGITFTVVDRPKLKSDGIDAVNSIFNQLTFNIKTTDHLRKMLSIYRYSWDEDLCRYSKEPIHDQAADAADALQTLALHYRYEETDGVMLGYPHAIPVAAFGGGDEYEYDVLGLGR